MIDFIWSLCMFLIAISVLVAFHEYGHFLIARACHVKVKRFSIGFGKIIWSRTDKKGTEFALSILPFGGYVKMLDERIEPILPQEKRYAFNYKPIWQRGAIIFAGPAFNFIFAILGYWLILMIGVTNVIPMIGQVTPNSIAAQAGLKSQQQIIKINQETVYSWQDVAITLLNAVGTPQLMPITVQDHAEKQHDYQLNLTQWHYQGSDMKLLESLGIKPYEPQIPAIIGDVKEDSPAGEAGLLAGDRIKAVNDKPVIEWQAVSDAIQKLPNVTITLTILRDGKLMHKKILVGRRNLSKNHAIGYIGVQSQPFTWPDKMKITERYSFLPALGHACSKTYQMSVTTLEMMGKMITGKLSVKGMSGPVGIAQSAGDSAKLGFVQFVSFLSVISISLAVLNLLPIPILDGGQLLFLLIEAIIRRPVSEKIQEASVKIGILILLGVMLLALYNDLSRIVYS